MTNSRGESRIAKFSVVMVGTIPHGVELAGMAPVGSVPVEAVRAEAVPVAPPPEYIVVVRPLSYPDHIYRDWRQPNPGR